MPPIQKTTHTNFENKMHNSIRDEKKIPKLRPQKQQQKNTLLHIYGETKKNLHTNEEKKKNLKLI